jgi:hypothetical protein
MPNPSTIVMDDDAFDAELEDRLRRKRHQQRQRERRARATRMADRAAELAGSPRDADRAPGYALAAIALALTEAE